MSGYAKRNLYRFAVVFFIVCAICCVVYFAYAAAGEIHVALVVLFAVLAIVLPVDVIVHELGHLFFGFLCGMKFVSVEIRGVCFSRKGVLFSKARYDGATKMFPKSPKSISLRAALFSVGGIAFNFAFSAVFTTLFFTVQRTPALLFFELCAPFNFLQGILSLYPVKLESGMTDGAFFFGIFKKDQETKAALTILRAQGTLYKGTFRELDFIVNAPILAEDNEYFHILKLLQFEYYFYVGDIPSASGQIERLLSLSSFLSRELSEEVAFEAAYFYAVELNDMERAERIIEGMEENTMPSCKRARRALNLPCNQKTDRDMLYGMRDYEEALIRRYGEK